MLPNLLDDLLRAWDTHPPAPATPAVAEPEPQEPAATERPFIEPAAEAPASESTEEPLLVPAWIEPPATVLPEDPFGTLLAGLAKSAEAEESGKADSSFVMDSLLTSLLADFDPASVEPVQNGIGTKVSEAPTPLPETAPRPSIPLVQSNPTGRKFVAVAMDSERLALPIEAVLEVGRCPRITFVPGLPAHVKGVLSFRGEVVPVVSMRAMAGLPELPNAPTDLSVESARFVAVQSSNGRHRAALVFDSLEGIVWIDTDAPGFASSQARFRDIKEKHPLASTLSSICLHDTTRYAVISVDRLLEEAGCTEGVAA